MENEFKSTAKTAYIIEYQKSKYDTIRFTIPKGKKELLIDLKNKERTSINKLIVEALEETYGIDLS